MARENVNIGVEGNDGTGDSIREAFRKVNQNFSEIYAIFGLGGAIGFTSLNDTPDSLTRDNPDAPGTNLGNLVPSTNAAGTAMLLRQLVGEGITIDTSDPDKIILSNTGGAINADKFPKVGGPLDLGTEKTNPLLTGHPIARVRIDNAAVDAFNAAHNLQGLNRITIDDLVIDKKYADTAFLSKYGDDSSGAVGLRNEPTDTDGYRYEISFVDPDTSEAQILNHGFNDGINGKPFVFTGVFPDSPAVDLKTGDTYYIRKRTSNLVTFHATPEDAISGLNVLVPAIGSILNGRYDPTLPGLWLENEALPRKSVVRRQGDVMEGPLILSDHPGLFAGLDTGVASDKQAATKYYVDQFSNSASTFMIYVTTDGKDVQPATPFGLEGRSSKFAFRTIGRAAELAEEQTTAAPVRPGPYIQTITTDSGANNSTVLFKGITDTTEQGLYTNFIELIDANKEFLKAEAVAYVNAQFPTFEYNTELCKRDVGLLIDSFVLDIRAGNNVNALTRIAGLRYFSSASGKLAIGNQFTETIAGVERVQSLMADILSNTPVTKTLGNPEDQGFTSNNAEGDSADQLNKLFNLFKQIVSGDEQGNPKGLASLPSLIEGSTFSLEISNGGNDYVDQADPKNFDIRQGKVIRGKTSGAIGRITEYAQGGSGSTHDTVYMQLLEPKEFILGEELEYGNFIKDVEISIRVDSGTYEEQYPIRVPQNVSIKGDEFRRVIVRPAPGVSQSKWAKMYFYRDNQFDGLDILPTHNPIAVDKIFNNTRFVVAETIAWINNKIATNATGWVGFVYDDIKCARDLNYILDGIIKDVKYGGNATSYENAKKYFNAAVSQVLGQETQTAAAITFAQGLVTDYVLTNTVYANPLQTNQTQVINALTTAEAGVTTTVTTLMSLISGVIVNGISALSNLDDPRYGYHYLTDPRDITSTPKENKDIDVFMMNDASLLRNLSPTGHGGFMCVLDPDGQILTKSPYIQTGSSFSQSINEKSFRGGMFVDAWSGNVPMLVTNVVNPFRLEVESIGNTGLFYKKPQMPAPFYIDGIRYQVNAIEDYNQILGKCTLVLDKTSGEKIVVGEPEGQGFQISVPTYYPDDLTPVNRSGGYQIIVQTAGGRSMLANDFTQINDLGYGVVGVNGALIELVSMFTYYCHTAYYASSGSQIRSLNGSNAYGNYGLIAEGSDPNEIPDAVELVNNMVQTALVYNNGTTYTTKLDDLFVYVYATDYVPLARGEIEIDHGGTIGLARYEVQSVQDVTAQDGVTAVHDQGGQRTRIYKLGFNTSGGDETAGTQGTSTTGLKALVDNNTPVQLRCNQNFKFDKVGNVTPIRPSTAVKFDEVAGDVYRSINFDKQDSIGTVLPNGVAVVTMDATYDYLRFTLVQPALSQPIPVSIDNTYTGTLGSQIGDTYLAVEKLTRSTDGLPDDVDRVRTGRFVTAWAGKKHKITGYYEPSGLTYAIIKLEDSGTTSLLAGDAVANGIAASFTSPDYDITIRAGLQGKAELADPSVQDATITFKISTNRATGHDFLDIGTGGFNTTNYPNVIFGDPTIIPEKPNPREVEERTEGRVFYVSTDQDGFFRVGKFFTVDQGTGTVTFSAAIALSNLDGLGFKRGVVVTAFLTDSGMTDNATDAVPTQSAVVGYVSRRLGYDKNGQPVSDFLSRYVSADNGQMFSTLNMNDNFITNVPDILVTDVDGSVAVNKRYVDGEVSAYSESTSLKDTEINAPVKNDLMIYTGYKRIIVSNTTPGNWATRIGETFTTYLGTDTGTVLGTATIIDVEDITLSGQGVTVITYELVSGSVLAVHNIISGTITGQIVQNGGPLDEIANATVTGSDISVELTRTVTYDVPTNTVDNNTTATLNINDGVIFNKHVNSAAGIVQSKLDLNAATTYDATNVASITQGNLGVAAFDDTEFSATDGLISLKTNGVDVDKLVQVGQYQALARTALGTGDLTAVSFSDIVANGIISTNAGEGNGKFVITLTGGGINAGTRLQINGNDTIKLTGSESNIISLYDSGANERIQITSGGVTVLGDILPNTTVSNRNIGSNTQKFNSAYITTLNGTATQAKYADLAENYLADAEYEPGTVLVFGGEQEVTACMIKGDRRVAGVVTTNPAHLMNSELQGDHVAGLALQGRVPCKVIGVVNKGDMLVSSAVPGYAIASNEPGIGEVIGKAVGVKTDAGKGTVEIVVGRV